MRHHLFLVLFLPFFLFYIFRYNLKWSSNERQWRQWRRLLLWLWKFLKIFKIANVINLFNSIIIHKGISACPIKQKQKLILCIQSYGDGQNGATFVVANFGFSSFAIEWESASIKNFTFILPWYLSLLNGSSERNIKCICVKSIAEKRESSNFNLQHGIYCRLHGNRVFLYFQCSSQV